MDPTVQNLQICMQIWTGIPPQSYDSLNPMIPKTYDSQNPKIPYGAFTAT